MTTTLNGSPRLGDQSKSMSYAQELVQIGSHNLNSPWPRRSDYEEYRLMRRDPTIAMARAAGMAPIKFTEWTVDGDNGEFCEAITEWWAEAGFDLVRRLLSALDYGWCPLEMYWDEAPSGLILPKFRSLRHEATKIVVDEKTGEPLGLEQKGVRLDPYNCVLYSHDKEYEDPYGRSRLENIRKNAWKPWVLCMEQLAKYHAKACGVLPIVRYPMGTSTGQNGETLDNSKHAQTILSRLSTVSGVTMPWKLEEWALELVRLGANPKDLMSWQVDFLDVPSGAGGEMLESLRHLDVMKIRGYLLPERSVIEGQFGTKAEAEVHTDVALGIAEETLKDIACVVNAQVLDTILAVNYGESMRGAVRLVPASIRSTQNEMAAEMLRAAFNHPYRGVEVLQAADISAIMDQFKIPRVKPTEKDPNDPANVPPVNDPNAVPVPEVGSETVEVPVN